MELTILSDGATQTYNPTSRIDNKYYVYNLGEVKTINKLGYVDRWRGDGAAYTLHGIFADGALLVDERARKTGDTQVSTASPKQGSGTVSSINSNVVTVNYTDNCFKEGQYLTVDKTINIEPNSERITSYTPATKTLVFDGPDNLSQFTNGDLVYMTNADGAPVSPNATGTVDYVDPENNKMVLSVSNDQWLEDYHVGTDPKPAITSTAYLQFDSTGAVSGYQATPVAPVRMDNLLSPSLTFPAEFESLQKTPDEEFSDTSAYLQTNIKLTNVVGSSNKDSNALVPTTTSTFAVHECDVCYNAEGVADMYANVLSKGIREATIRLINAEETVAQTLERVKNFVETYVDSESH